MLRIFIFLGALRLGRWWASGPEKCYKKRDWFDWLIDISKFRLLEFRFKQKVKNLKKLTIFTLTSMNALLPKIRKDIRFWLKG